MPYQWITHLDASGARRHYGA